MKILRFDFFILPFLSVVWFLVNILHSPLVNLFFVFFTFFYSVCYYLNFPNVNNWRNNIPEAPIVTRRLFDYHIANFINIMSHG